MRGLIQTLVLATASLTLAVTDAGEQKGSIKPTEYGQPELVAITWQACAERGFNSPTLWRPDGSMIGDVEAAWLTSDQETLDGNSWDSRQILWPLTFIFRIDERARSKQAITGQLNANHKSLRSHHTFDSTKHHLVRTTFFAAKSDIGQWPDQLDLTIQYPVAEPEVLLDQLSPAETVAVRPGLRWFIDQRSGRLLFDRERKEFPAAVLDIDRKLVDRLLTFSARVWLEPEKEFEPGGYRVCDGPGDSVTKLVSAPLLEGQKIHRLEIVQLRHREATFDHVPIRLDLLPKNEGFVKERAKLAVVEASQVIVSDGGDELSPKKGIPVGTKFVVRTRFRLAEREVRTPRLVVAQISSQGEKGPVLMGSNSGSAKLVADRVYEVEVPLTAFNRPGKYDLSVGNVELDLGRTDLIITR